MARGAPVGSGSDSQSALQQTPCQGPTESVLQPVAARQTVFHAVQESDVHSWNVCVLFGWTVKPLLANILFRSRRVPMDFHS